MPTRARSWQVADTLRETWGIDATEPRIAGKRLTTMAWLNWVLGISREVPDLGTIRSMDMIR